jgi:hypothetical protein
MGYLGLVRVGYNQSCPSGTPNGYEKVIDWQVVDRDGSAITYSMPTSDTGNYSRNDWGLEGFEGSSGYTGDTGMWRHRYWFCTYSYNCPGSGQVEGIQHFTSNGFGFDLPFVFRCDSITVNGH